MVDFLVFGLLVLSLKDGSYGDTETYVYVQENETATLSCSLDVAAWWGPSNLTTYVSGFELDPQLPKFNRLTFSLNQTTNSSELQIREFSREDEGLYKCSYLENGTFQSIIETVLIKKDPTNVTILEAANTFLYAKSNYVVNLTCCVESGIPNDETIIWKRNEKELARGGPASLTYTFITGVEDHLQNFTCMVQTPSTSLHKCVQMFLYFPPTVQILQGSLVRVVEGSALDLKCIYTSSSRIIGILWQTHENILTNSSQLHLSSITREQTGQYSCTVLNQVGNVTAHVKIEVLYPPDVIVSFSDNDRKRKLKCNPNGFPNRYSFSKWEHKSELREHIRFLPSTNSGIISIPYVKGESDRHFDRGVYICTVSNNISVDNRMFVSAEYLLNSTGKPYFVTSNMATQYSILSQKFMLTADIVNFETLNDVALFSDKMKIFNFSSTMQSPSLVKDIVYGKNILLRGTRLMFPITTQTIDDFRQYVVVANNTIGSSRYEIFLGSARPLRAPYDIKAVAMDHTIIVKWTADHDIGLQETFLVEYRKYYESSWNKVYTEDRSTAVINGLDPDTVYVLRVYSKTAAGESDKTNDIIVKTEKHHYKIQDLTTEFAYIIGAVLLINFLFWCGMKALGNRHILCRKKDRKPLSPRNEEISTRNDESSSRNGETSTRLAQYEEIDSSYYNPQDIRNISLQEVQQPLNSNGNLKNFETNTFSSQNVTLGAEERDSPRPSSDNSYLVPCMSYTNIDIESDIENVCFDSNTLIADIHVQEKLSISSNSSDTDTKGIPKYEKLQISHSNEHEYQEAE